MSNSFGTVFKLTRLIKILFKKNLTEENPDNHTLLHNAKKMMT